MMPQREIPAKCLAAMIAVDPLPGSPLFEGSVERLVERAMSDLEVYSGGGVDSVLLENSFDLPYIKSPLPDEALEAMTKVAKAVRSRFRGPVGIQMLEAANIEALEIAAECDLDFVRVEGFVFAHIGGAGLIEGCAGKLLRRRRELGVSSIRIFSDLKKKHCSHAITGDTDIAEHARQAEFFLTDGHIVTGPRTGAEPEISDLDSVRNVSRQPVWIGSGVTVSNLSSLYERADGFIVGSTFRENGNFRGRLEKNRFDQFMDTFRGLKSAMSGE